MKISVLIIAHNEDQYIQKSIESILRQSIKADEVILLAHNCTDRTINLAEQYSITVIPFESSAGIVHARIEGLRHTNGDVILCIDGDSFASDNWIEVMTSVLEKENVLVGSRVKFKGTLYGSIGNIVNQHSFNSQGEKAADWIWGVSFGFWSKDKEKVQSILRQSIELSKRLHLTRNPDDYWLALLMSREGNIEVTGKTYVVNNTKERNSLKAVKRNIENVRNGVIIRSYFRKELRDV